MADKDCGKVCGCQFADKDIVPELVADQLLNSFSKAQGILDWRLLHVVRRYREISCAAASGLVLYPACKNI